MELKQKDWVVKSSALSASEFLITTIDLFFLWITHLLRNCRVVTDGKCNKPWRLARRKSRQKRECDFSVVYSIYRRSFYQPGFFSYNSSKLMVFNIKWYKFNPCISHWDSYTRKYKLSINRIPPDRHRFFELSFILFYFIYWMCLWFLYTNSVSLCNTNVYLDQMMMALSWCCYQTYSKHSTKNHSKEEISRFLNIF